MDNLYYTTHDSAIGTLLLVASNRGLRYLNMLDSADEAEAALKQHFGATLPALMPGFFTTATQAIDAYLLQGESLRLPVDLAGGTALQRSVWLAIAKIPYGETLSYTDLAEKVGFPRAVRAVASACGANPVALAIPCHRVIAKDGSLGGFSMGGVHIKERLLAREAKREEAAAA